MPAPCKSPERSFRATAFTPQERSQKDLHTMIFTCYSAAFGVILGDFVFNHSAPAPLVAKNVKSASVAELKQPAPELKLSISKDGAPKEIMDFMKTNPSLAIIRLTDDFNDPSKLSLHAVMRQEADRKTKMILAPDNTELPQNIFDNITAHYRFPDSGLTIILYCETSP
jgi:hypothetical protein